MKPITFPGHNMTLAEDQPEYLPLPVCYHGGDEGAMTSCWKLTWWERIKVLFTGSIYFNQFTFNQPLQPQRPDVDWKEPVCENCGNGVGAHKHPQFNCPSDSSSNSKKQRAMKRSFSFYIQLGRFKIPIIEYSEG
jgi:hypothetical protein